VQICRVLGAKKVISGFSQALALTAQKQQESPWSHVSSQTRLTTGLLADSSPFLLSTYDSWAYKIMLSRHEVTTAKLLENFYSKFPCAQRLSRDLRRKQRI